MADWQRHLYLNPEWDQAKEGEITRQQLAASIAKKLRALKPFPTTLGDLNDLRDDIAADFASMATEKDLSISDFDGQMCALYDWGDERISPEWNGKKACWIDTMSRSPALSLPGAKVMFGRTVTIDGTQVFVCCTPQTPYSEICLRAAKLFKIEEEREAHARASALADARSRTPDRSSPNSGE